MTLRIMGMRSSIFVVWVSLVLGLFALAPSPSLANTRLWRLVTGELGEFVFTRHSYGERWAQRLLGRRISGTPDELTALARALEADTAQARLIRGPMEDRLVAIQSELDVSEVAARGARARERVLRDLIQRHFPSRLSATVSGALEFVPFVRTGGPSTYAQVRELMSRVRSIEEALPLRAGSIEGDLVARNQEPVYDRIMGLHRRYLQEGAILDSGGLARSVMARTGRRSANLVEALEEQMRLQHELATELETLANAYRRIPVLEESLRSAARQVRPTAEAVQDLTAYRGTFLQIESGTTPFRRAIAEYGSKVPGEIGELRILVRETGIAARGVRARNIGVHWVSGAREGREALVRIVRENSQLFSRELDLIIDNGRVFGEIKAYLHPMSFNHPKWAQVFEQASKATEIRNLLNGSEAIRRAVGTSIKQRIYFINGIEDGAAIELERLGIEVYGARLPDSGAGVLFQGAG